jgi:phosphate-selective porin OprO/OprP
MKLAVRTSALALAMAAGWAMPVHAQSVDAAALQRELAAMREQMERMASRIDTLESQLVSANAKADAAAAAASDAGIKASAANALAKDTGARVKWKGAPEITGEHGWSFKPRGRMQFDVAGVDAPGGLSAGNEHLGTSTEFRRAQIGFDGTMPGGFGYRVEANLANSEVELTDLYLTYNASKSLTLTVGQHKPFWGLEEMTSDLFTSMMERAAFSQAFGFERRVGASAAWSSGSFLVQGGVFSDDASALNADSNKSWSLDGRVVAMPKVAGGMLHVGGSIHLRDLGGSVNTARYRARPFVHTTDVRLVDTGSFGASGERAYGAELAWVKGRFHATGESYWMTSMRPGQANPTFNGGYGELGLFLTDDSTAYKNGTYDRTKPKRPVSAGGIGAVQVNVRYDWLDLNDAGIIGGRQQIAGISVIWTPMDYVRFMANYGHIRVRDARVTASGDGSYNAHAAGMRAQLDF